MSAVVARHSTAAIGLALAALLAVVPAASSAATEIDLPSGARNPMAVGIDDNGDLWVTLDGSWGIVEIAPATLQARYAQLPGQNANQSDSLWAVRPSGGAVWTAGERAAYRVNSSTLEVETFAFPQVSQLAGDVHVAGDTVWTVLVTEDKLVRIALSTGAVTTVDLPRGPVGILEFADAGPAGVYFSATYGNTWGRLDAATGQIILGPPGVVQAPTGVAWDAGKLWLGEHGASSLVRVDPTTGTIERFPTSPSPYYPVSGPSGVLVARDGSVWFAEHFADRVSRFDPANRTLVEYEVASSPGVNVQRVVEGKDGRVWFAEWSKHKIGFATYGGESPVLDVPNPIRVPAGGIVRVPIAFAANGVAGVGVPFLEAEIDGDNLVISAAPRSAEGEHNLFVGAKQGKTTAGKYVTVVVGPARADGNGTPAADALAAVAAIAALAFLRRRG